MRSQVSTILRNATRNENEPLNILGCCTHESSQTEQAKTGHNFYMFRSKSLKEWNTDYRPVPENFTLLEHDCLPSDVDFDLILSQSNSDQYPILKKISLQYNVPLLCYHHTAPHTDTPPSLIRTMKSNVVADAHIFISAFSRDAWGYAESEGVVLRHGIDTGLFKPREETKREPVLLSVVNKWAERDEFCGYKLWETITRGDTALPVTALGDNPGLSSPATSVDDLSFHYAKSLVYLNTSLISPIPTSLMEGASSGCAIVSTANCAIPEVFTDGVDCLMSNDPRELRNHCRMLLSNPDIAAEFGRRARETIVNNFSLDKYIQGLNDIFHGVLRQ